MSYIEKPIADWKSQEGAIHKPGDEGPCPPEGGESSLPKPSHEHIEHFGEVMSEGAKPMGDNPSISADGALANIGRGQGDQRHYEGAPESNPTPAMPGA